jgi:hypothetical protein
MTVTKPRTETIEEFLARGGQITKVPAATLEDAKVIIPTRTTISYGMMSLSEGEHLFGETRAKVAPMKKRINDDEFAKMLDNINLPANIVESLKKTIKT